MHLKRSWQRLSYIIGGVLLLGSILSAPASEAATYYVATNGSGSTCSQAAPCLTIAAGINKLSAGDTLYVRAGTYAEALGNAIPSGTSSASPTLVSAYPGETVTLRPSSGTNNGLISFQGGSKQYIIINGFIIDGSNDWSSHGVLIGSQSTNPNGQCCDANHIIIQNCEIKNAYYNGVAIGEGANFNQFINLHVHDNGLRSITPGTCAVSHGFYVRSQNNLIQGGSSHGNAGSGIQLYYGLHGVDNNTIDGVDVYTNNQANAGCPNMFLWSGSGNTLKNSIIRNNGSDGVDASSSSASNLTVVNNTFYANTGTALILAGDTVSGVAVKNNIIYGNGSQIANAGSGTAFQTNLCGSSGTGCALMGNPLFVNAGTHDFHLQSGSPAINAGTTVSSLTTDHDGVSRPQGGGYDIGAFEYVATPSLAAPANFRIVHF